MIQYHKIKYMIQSHITSNTIAYFSMIRYDMIQQYHIIQDHFIS